MSNKVAVWSTAIRFLILYIGTMSFCVMAVLFTNISVGLTPFGQAVFIIFSPIAFLIAIDPPSKISEYIVNWAFVKIAPGSKTMYHGYFRLDLENSQRAGFVYLIRRLEDGVYKIGYTTKPFKKRISALNKKYKGVEIVCLWESPEPRESEKAALDMTKCFEFDDGFGEKELREMNQDEIVNFSLDFSDYMKRVDATWGDIQDIKNKYGVDDELQ